VLPNGRLDALRQVALFATAYYGYRVVRGLIESEVHVAFENARHIVDIERALGLFFEPGVQAWALSNRWVADAASWAYVNTHFTLTTTFLIWLYLARNDAYYYVRNMFMVAMALALVGYLAFPTAPPRLMPEWGFTDTVVALVGESRARGAEALFNPFAAIPSMHVAFALMIGIPGARLVRRRALKAWWAAYPAIVSCVVVLTANHFWLDAALGALVAAVSAWAAHAALARARPDAWSWRSSAPAEATA
jgi:membrane-associated phospholipid phosphatase